MAEPENVDSSPVAEPSVQPKFVLASRTWLWNIAQLAFYALQSVTDTHILGPGPQLIVAVVGNMLVRLITSQPVTLLPIREKTDG